MGPAGGSKGDLPERKRPFLRMHFPILSHEARGLKPISLTAGGAGAVCVQDRSNKQWRRLGGGIGGGGGEAATESPAEC